MGEITLEWKELLSGVMSINLKMIIMYLIGLALIIVAIKKNYEPMLLLPIGFGAILVNLPLSVVKYASEPVKYDFVTQLARNNEGVREFFESNLNFFFNEAGEAFHYEPGFLEILLRSGILTELFPVLIFIGVGAMIDFTPLFKNPVMIFFGAAAQFGIFATMLVAILFDFDLKAASAIGIIGAADGPTAIYVASKFAKEYFGPISVAAYSYMSLVPIIQPPVIKLLTTKKERMIRMEYREEKVPKIVLIAFPIAVTIIAGIVAPISVPLVGSLMFGNLIRECGVLERLSQAAQNELSNLVTLLLGITIGSTMLADNFLKLGNTIDPGHGPGGIRIRYGRRGFVCEVSQPVPQGRQQVQPHDRRRRYFGISNVGQGDPAEWLKEEDPTNFVLMQAVSANVSGQLGSILAGGFVLALVPILVR
jgi:sodium ion-translocating decarboxylase beta subunit